MKFILKLSLHPTRWVVELGEWGTILEVKASVETKIIALAVFETCLFNVNKNDFVVIEESNTAFNRHIVFETSPSFLEKICTIKY